MSSSLNLCLKIIRISASLPDEVLCLVQICSFSSHPVKLHQCKFNLLMARIASLLSFTCTKYPAYKICIFSGNVQEVLLASCLVIGNSCLDHMSGCVQFVAFHQVGPLLRRSIDGKISVQVTIWLLGFPDQVNDFICQFFQILSPSSGYGVGNGFQPFVKVCVLKNNSFSLSLFLSCGNAEIADTIGRL